MSLEAFGDEGNVPHRGEETQMYHDLLAVRERWSKWCREWRKELPGSDHELQADKVSDALDEMIESLEGAAMKPICVPCQRFFRPKKNGFPFIEGMPKSNDAEPGTAEPDQWKPYKLWMGDKWGCEGCGTEIVVGVGRDPIAEHYQPQFAVTVGRYGVDLQVNDC